MMPLRFGIKDLRILCLGAHSDDIEIGAGGTILTLLGQGLKLDVSWCVLNGVGDREREAWMSAGDFLSGAANAHVEVMQFRNSYFPAQAAEIKAWFETLKERIRPDVIFTHHGNDAHQDHREVSRHTWSTFRDQLVLEYEIPKWDGDLGQPNIYVPLSSEILERKIGLLTSRFGTQRTKDWFDDETFRGLARLRGMECRAPERYAEAFFARKLVLAAG